LANELLTIVGFAFKAGSSLGDQFVAVPVTASARVTVPSVTLSNGRQVFRINVAPRPGWCGAALLDQRGRLVGIASIGAGNEMLAIGTSTIRHVMNKATAMDP
jgi:S1-C subfamily serine protease